MNGGVCEEEAASLTFVTLHVCSTQPLLTSPTQSALIDIPEIPERRVRDLGEVHVLLRCLVRAGAAGAGQSSGGEREHSWSSHLNPAHSLYGGRLTTTASPPPTDVMASSDGQTITSHTIAILITSRPGHCRLTT